jgi:hypothetical protein
MMDLPTYWPDHWDILVYLHTYMFCIDPVDNWAEKFLWPSDIKAKMVS